MYVTRSHSVEHLAVRLARVAQRPLKRPLGPEWITIDSPGLERWLMGLLAERLGVWASGPVLRTDAALERLADMVDPDGPPASPWRAPSLRHAVADTLPTVSLPAELASWLGGPAARRDALARQLATALRTWSIHRPDVIASWEEGADDWRAGLWRSLVARLGDGHPGRRAARAAERLRDRMPLSGLPERVHLFALEPSSGLALDVFDALSARIPVHLWHLSPSPLWFADDQRADLGLLGQLGRSAMAWERELVNVDTSPNPFDAAAEPPASTTRLGRLQRAIHELTPTDDLGAGSPTDRSIAIVSAEGAVRQAEALRDAIAALRREAPDLRAEDVVVAVPDIDAMAPSIHAAFSGFVPYHLADQPLWRASPAIAGAIDLLTAATGRATSAGLLNLLRRDAVRRAVGLERADLDTIHAVVSSAGIRWGFDPAHRRAQGVDAGQGGTWREGLDRALLGVALPPAGGHTFGDVLPVELPDRDALRCIAALATWIGALQTWHQATLEPQPMAVWVAKTTKWFSELLAPEDDDDRNGLETAVSALHDLSEAARDAGRTTPVPWAEFAASAVERIASLRSRSRILGGGIAFASPEALRAVPARVVAWLGLDAGAWPRLQTSHGWDLMATVRPGDPNRRDADRDTFLVSLLSARDAFIVVHGRGARATPSALVPTLRDALARLEGADVGLTDPLPREPWSASRYSDDARWPGDARWFDAAAAALSPPRPIDHPFAREVPPDPPSTVSLRVVELALSKPQRVLPKTRLRLDLSPFKRVFTDVDLLDLDGLERWSRDDVVLATLRRGVDPERGWAALATSGDWPRGAAGRAAFLRSVRLGQRLLAAETAAREGRPATEPLWFHHATAEAECQGWITGRYGDRRIVASVSGLKPEKTFGQWVHHLAACVADPKHLITVLIGRGEGDQPATQVLNRPTDPDREFRRVVAFAVRSQHKLLPWSPDLQNDESSPAQRLKNSARYDEYLTTLWGPGLERFPAWNEGNPSPAKMVETLSKPLWDALKS